MLLSPQRRALIQKRYVGTPSILTTVTGIEPISFLRRLCKSLPRYAKSHTLQHFCVVAHDFYTKMRRQPLADAKHLQGHIFRPAGPFLTTFDPNPCMVIPFLF